MVSRALARGEGSSAATGSLAEGRLARGLAPAGADGVRADQGRVAGRASLRVRVDVLSSWPAIRCHGEATSDSLRKASPFHRSAAADEERQCRHRLALERAI